MPRGVPRERSRRHEAGAVEPLFLTRAMGNSFRYDAAPDGRRFLVTTSTPDPSTPSLSLVLGRTGMLERR